MYPGDGRRRLPSRSACSLAFSPPQSPSKWPCITFVVQMPRGFGRMELFLIWGIVMFAIALRGGGPYSLDRKIGKEL